MKDEPWGSLPNANCRIAIPGKPYRSRSASTSSVIIPRFSATIGRSPRSEEHTSELQSHSDLHSFPTRRSSDLGELQDRHPGEAVPLAERLHLVGDHSQVLGHDRQIA